jgi:glycosyltransferase involved in cell wall biosynthesis
LLGHAVEMPSRKHLLHIFPTFAVGGSQIRFGQLAKLHGAKYQHTVIALDGNFSMADRLQGLTIAMHPLTFNKKNTFGSWLVFRRVLRTLRPDTLVTYNWGSIDWAIVNRLGHSIPHVHIEDGFGPEEATRQLQRRVLTRRLALSGPETDVILPSHTLDRIAEVDWKAPRHHYIPNGIDCARFSAPGRIAKRSGSGVVIGTVATLRREKNIARLIRAFSDLAVKRKPGSVHLLIVGDGSERPGLEHLAASLPVAAQICFAGPSDHPEEWLRKIDIFALSSDTEQMPLSVLEAMASGLPVVSTQVGDVAQMVCAGNVDLVVPAETFGQALEMLIDDPSRQLAIGRENANRARELFDETVMGKRYARIIG